jgi:hypothetical protein
MKSGRLWPWAIAGVLAATVGLNIWVWVLANDPDGSAVEPDYYRKAVAWDSTRVQLDRDARLGWRLDARLGAWGGAASPTALDVALEDSAGRPLTGATIAVTAIHNALAAHPLAFALAPAEAPGSYAAAPVLPRQGSWELRFEVTRPGEHFTADLRRDTAPGAGAAR